MKWSKVFSHATSGGLFAAFGQMGAYLTIKFIERNLMPEHIASAVLAMTAIYTAIIAGALNYLNHRKKK